MRALTLHRPWPWAMLHLPVELAKPVENRTWSPPRFVWRQRIALHAGKTFDHAGAAWIESTFGVAVPREHEHPLGIVGVATVGGYRDASGMVRWPSGDARTWQWVPAGAPTPRGFADGGRWFVGPVGWFLDDRIVLATALPCKGAQGLWVVPPHFEALVVHQLAAVAAERTA